MLYSPEFAAVCLIVRSVDYTLTEIIEINIGILKISHRAAYLENPAIDIIFRMTHYVVIYSKEIPPRAFSGKSYNLVLVEIAEILRRRQRIGRLVKIDGQSMGVGTVCPGIDNCCVEDGHYHLRFFLHHGKIVF
jgi:hypothetical protein